MKKLFSVNATSCTYLFMSLFVLFCTLTSPAAPTAAGPMSPQWKKCWGHGHWYGGCLEIKISWSLHSNHDSKTDMQSLVDKIDVSLNEAQTGLVFTFPPELKGANFTLQSKFVSKAKPGSGKKITINPGTYNIPETLKVTTNQIAMHKVSA